MPTVYRIVKRRHPVYDGKGAALAGGRWSSPGREVVYAAGSYAGALLEILAQAGRVKLPGLHHAAAIEIPDDLLLERFDDAAHPGWDAPSSAVARTYGDAWLAGGRTAVLEVPSVPGRPVERNYVIHLAHPESPRVRPGPTFEVPWDERLVSR